MPGPSGGAHLGPPLAFTGHRTAEPIRTGWDAVAPTPGSSSAGHYTHTQTDPTSVITINHALGYRPAGVALFSLDYAVKYRGFGVQHLTENTLRVSMDKPTACVVVLS